MWRPFTLMITDVTETASHHQQSPAQDDLNCNGRAWRLLLAKVLIHHNIGIFRVVSADSRNSWLSPLAVTSLNTLGALGFCTLS